MLSLSPSAGSVDAPENVPSDLKPATSAPPSTKRKPPPPPIPTLKAKGMLYDYVNYQCMAGN